MLLSELKVHNKWKACEGMWTLVLLPGVKFQDYIKLHVSLPPQPAGSSDCAYECSAKFKGQGLLSE